MRDIATAVQPGGVRQRFQRARVESISGTLLTVALDDSVDPIVCRALLGTTYAVDDVVMVARDGTGSFVVGKMGSAAPPPVVENPPAVKLVKRTATILPTFTDTYRSGRWLGTGEISQGDWGSYGWKQGAAYYGRQLAALDADLTKSRSATLYYYRQSGGVFGAQAPTVWTLSGNRKPSGGPSRLTSAVADSVAVNRAESWKLPTGMLDELLDGTAGGLGIYVASSSPYIVLSGRQDYAKAFALAVTYYTKD